MKPVSSGIEAGAMVNADVEAMGVKVLAQYALLGMYDFLNILEAPDEVTMAKVATTLASRGRPVRNAAVSVGLVSGVPVEQRAHAEALLAQAPNGTDGCRGARERGDARHLVHHGRAPHGAIVETDEVVRDPAPEPEPIS